MPALEPEVPYSAYSGANMTAMVGNRKLGSLQAISCSISRELMALYAAGDTNPKTFVKGKRGISGGVVFTTFDRDALLFDLFKGSYNRPLSQFSGPGSRGLELETNQGLLSNARIPTRDFNQVGEFAGNIAEAYGDTVDPSIISELEDLYTNAANQRTRYADQLPEFDITLSFVNENGSASFLEIIGVTIGNESFAFDINDLTSDKAYTYVARHVTPLTSLTNERIWKPGRAIAPSNLSFA